MGVLNLRHIRVQGGVLCVQVCRQHHADLATEFGGNACGIPRKLVTPDAELLALDVAERGLTQKLELDTGRHTLSRSVTALPQRLPSLGNYLPASDDAFAISRVARLGRPYPAERR